jgi:hypothetical protein
MQILYLTDSVALEYYSRRDGLGRPYEGARLVVAKYIGPPELPEFTGDDADKVLAESVTAIARIDKLVVGTGFNFEKESNVAEWFLVRQNRKVECEFFSSEKALLTRLRELGNPITELLLQGPRKLVQEGAR